MFLFPSTVLFGPFAKKSNNFNGPQLKPYTINRILWKTFPFNSFVYKPTLLDKGYGSNYDVIEEYFMFTFITIECCPISLLECNFHS
jgi:hypothetical protein